MIIDYPADYVTPEEMLDEEAMGLPEGGLERLLAISQVDGDLTPYLDTDQLVEIGSRCVDDWERDKGDNSEWREMAEEALERASQAKPEQKTYPFDGAANVKYPILTVAAQQFAARAYPAIVKGDEAVQIKVIGNDPNGQKQARADRVKTYMNYTIFYSMQGWEDDTDTLLNQLPIVGQAFRKVFYDPIRGIMRSEFVSGLNVTVPKDARSLMDAPRVTQDYKAFPYQIKARQRSGEFREVDLDSGTEDEQEPRCLIEQHCLIDLDLDGVEEPYIATVDVESRELLRLEAAFRPSGVRIKGERVVAIDRWMPFVGYQFIPDPKGGFYGIGFGQLLRPLSDVIDSIINLSLDAGHAQVAGGGFLAQGLRLQGSGQTNMLRFQPGEYKTVNVPGGNIAQSIYERTFPAPSEVLFQLLGLLMEAAQDISSVKDVLTGEAPRNQTATATLALIEQGMTTFTAIYKRVYRGLKAEFQLIYDGIAAHPDEERYLEVVDAPEPEPVQEAMGMPPEGALQAPQGQPAMMGPQGAMPVPTQATEPPSIERDFNTADQDIRPVSDPTAVTKMQEMAKAGFLGQFIGDPSLDQTKIKSRMFEAAGIDDFEGLFAEPDMMQQQLQMMQMKQQMEMAQAALEKLKADTAKIMSEVPKNEAQTKTYLSQAVENTTDAAVKAFEAGRGGLPDMEGQPRDPMGSGGFSPTV